MGTEQHEAASQKPDATKILGEFMPDKKGEELSGKGNEKAREAAKKQLKSAADKIMKKYHKKGALKNSDEVKARAEDAAEELNAIIKQYTNLAKNLPDNYDQYVGSFMLADPENDSTHIYGISIKKVDGELKAQSYDDSDTPGRRAVGDAP